MPMSRPALASSAWTPALNSTTSCVSGIISNLARSLLAEDSLPERVLSRRYRKWTPNRYSCTETTESAAREFSSSTALASLTAPGSSFTRSTTKVVSKRRSVSAPCEFLRCLLLRLGEVKRRESPVLLADGISPCKVGQISPPLQTSSYDPRETLPRQLELLQQFVNVVRDRDCSSHL